MLVRGEVWTREVSEKQTSQQPAPALPFASYAPRAPEQLVGGRVGGHQQAHARVVQLVQQRDEAARLVAHLQGHGRHLQGAGDREGGGREGGQRVRAGRMWARMGAWHVHSVMRCMQVRKCEQAGALGTSATVQAHGAGKHGLDMSHK